MNRRTDALVIIVAFINIATVLLAWLPGRRHEFLVRIALGATTGRLVRQVLLETLIWAGAGTLAGLAIATWFVQLFQQQPDFSLVSIDCRRSPGPIKRIRRLTLLLTFVGLYARTAHGVAVRALEAVGARPADVIRNALSDTAAVIAMGTAAGAPPQSGVIVDRYGRAADMKSRSGVVTLTVRYSSTYFFCAPLQARSVRSYAATRESCVVETSILSPGSR